MSTPQGIVWRCPCPISHQQSPPSSPRTGRLFHRSHLRLVYEGNPMGWVVEQAGGKASTGAGAMLEQEVSPLSFDSLSVHCLRGCVHAAGIHMACGLMLRCGTLKPWQWLLIGKACLHCCLDRCCRHSSPVVCVCLPGIFLYLGHGPTLLVDLQYCFSLEIVGAFVCCHAPFATFDPCSVWPQ